MSLTAAELRAVYVIDEGPLDKSLAGIPGKVGKVKPGDVKIDGDDKGLQRTVVSAEKGMGRLGSAVKASLGAIAGYFAFDAVTRFVGDSITAASDLSETVNKSNAIFEANAAAVNTWAKGSTRSVGLSRQAALDAAAGFGDMFSQIGFAGDEAAKLSMRVVQMSADLGSFNNLPTAEVSDRISAAFRGEYDSLQALIPNINAARVETEALAATGKKNAAELTAQEKATAVLAIVQKDGARAMGDFTRTADQNANSAKIAAAQWENAKARLGDLLVGPMTAITHFASDKMIPAFESVVDVGGDFLGFLAALPGPVQLAAVGFAAMAVFGGPLTTMFGGLRGVVGGVTGTVGAFTEALGYARANGDGLNTVLRSVGSTAVDSAKRGLAWLTRAIGPELGVAAAVLTVSYLVDGFQSLTSASDEAKASAEGLAEALTLTDKAADRRSVRQAIEDTEGLVEIMDKAGVSSEDAINGLLGQAAAQDRVTEALQRYMGSRPARGDNAAEGVRQTILAYGELATGYGTAAGNARFFAGESEAVAAGVEGSGEAAAGAAPQVDDYATKLQDSADAASDAKKQTDLLKLSLDLLTGKHVDMIQVETAFYDAVRDAEGALKDLDGRVLDAAGNLNTHSEAGSKTSDVLIDIADNANNWIATMLTQGAAASDVALKDAELRKSFYDTALQMTGSKQAAENLTNQIYGIPAERNTRIGVDKAAAEIAITGVKNLLGGLTDKTVTLTVNAATTGLNAIQSLLFGGPKRAAGGPVWPGQAFLVGEEGPELVRFTGHGQVIPAEQTRALMAGSSSSQLMGAADAQAMSGLTARVPAGAAPTPARPVRGSGASGGGPEKLLNIENYWEQPGSSPAATAAALGVEVRTRPWT